jgi:predicted XRE-type DNA-binding protein
MGISQPDVSNLLRGQFEGFSPERLLEFVRALGIMRTARAVMKKRRHALRELANK